MKARHRCTRRLAYASLFLLLLVPAASPYDSQATAPKQGQKQEADQTIHVNVGLCQTDVMVFDRQGRFVPNLKMDQFELRVDGKVQPISFFELVSAGSVHDEEVWAREEAKPVPPLPQAAATNANPGRTLVFFLDDWHMDAENVVRARAALAKLVNTEMGPKDRVALCAASGQLGSKQQLTSDKATLLASIAKFNFQSAGVQDLQWPPMTEGQAFLIEQNDRDVINYFAAEMQKSDPFFGDKGVQMRDPNAPPPAGLVQAIQHRAAQLASTSAAIGARTLSALRDVVRSCATLPGRKVIFFLSDGFVLQPQRSDVVDGLQQLTIAAARLGIMIYTLDTRGLVVGLPDAKRKRAADSTGALAHSGYSEILPQQDALNALAADTGGRFLKNTNALDTAMITTLSEISRYYLLAWPFDPEVVKPGKYSTIKASVKGRPDLTVRVRQGSLDLAELISTKADTNKTPDKSEPAAPLPPRLTEAEIYARAVPIVDFSVEDLRLTYPSELADLEFAADQAELAPLLRKVGESVMAFFSDFPNTASKERVRLERLQGDGKVQDHLEQNFDYIIEVHSKDAGLDLEEFRTDGHGRPIVLQHLRGFSTLNTGFAASNILFHPSYQSYSRFRYLGSQKSSPRSQVIAFSQKTGDGSAASKFETTGMAPALLYYQGLAWVDPQTNQIMRMRMDLLAPRSDIGLDRQTTEIWFSEVHFNGVSHSFWLPQEIVITTKWMGDLLRNRYQYSDYSVFLVESHDKIELPIKKKKP